MLHPPIPTAVKQLSKAPAQHKHKVTPIQPGSSVTRLDHSTHRCRLALEEELLDVDGPVLLPALLALALLDRGRSILSFGARLQDRLQLLRSGVDHLLRSGTLAVS